MATGLGQVDMEEFTSEFDLPDLNHLPSLESILREDDAHSGTVHDDDQSTVQTDIGESTSLCSYDSKARSRFKNKTVIEKHGPVLKRNILRGISSQIVAANSSRVEAGIPTCLHCSLQFIAVGTSKGMSLIFEKSQTMKWCLRLPAEEEVASVSALVISSDSKRLLAGYSRGQLSLWDLKSGLLLHLSRDIQTALFCVLHLKFTSIENVAMVTDSGGSMYQAILKNNRKTIQTSCIFSGSNGEVLTVSPFNVHAKAGQSLKTLAKMCIVAFATVTKLIVISLNPVMNIHFTYPLKAEPSSCPLISWLIPSNSPPLIAFARGCLVNVYGLTLQNPKLNFSFLKNIQLGYSLQTMNWVNSSVIMLTDIQEHVHVMDFDSMEELESIDANDHQFVYGSAFFKGLATGGNVSEAMRLAGERACYNSICPSTAIDGSLDRLFVLGVKTVIIYTIRSWDDRIDWFVKQNKYPEALALASTFYSGEARAILGLPSSPQERRKVVARKTIDLIKEYIDQGTRQLTPAQGSVDLLLDHYNQVIPVCVEHSSSIGSDGESLITQISEKLCNDIIAQSILFECLQENISNGRFQNLNPEMVKDIIEYFEGRQRFLDVEAIIICLNISCLDIHQCMTVCRKHNLIDGIIHLHNQAFCDFISPLLEIFDRIQEKVLKKEKLGDQDSEIGMKLLVYISCCLTGRAYPYGDIEEKERRRVRSEVISFIAERDCRTIKIPFANLRTLLYFDTSEFLNVLSLAFEIESFDEEWNIYLEQNQKLVDTLLQVMTGSDSTEFSPSQLGSLYMFLARQVSKRESSILVSKSLLEEIVLFLTNNSDDKRVEDRQQALLESAQCGKIDKELMDKMLDCSLQVGFFRVCEYVYWEKRCFDKIFSSILQDEPRKYHIFSRIDQIMSSNSEASSEEKKIFMKSVLEKVKDLCQIDCQQTAKLLNQRVNHEQELKAILKSLESDQHILYKLLNCLLPGAIDHVTDLNGRYKYLTENAITEKFIELMCVYEPESVATFLSQSTSYRRNVALDLCQNYRVHEGSAYLLEQDERFLEAFDLRFKRFHQLASPAFGPHFLGTEVEKIEVELNKILRFCERASEKTISDKDKQPLWFPLLEHVQSLHKYGSTDEIKGKLNHLTDMIFNEMIRFVSLISILQWMLQDPSKAKLSDVKDLLMKAIDACNCEASLFESTSRLLNADLHRQMSLLTTKSRKAIQSKSNILSCGKCGKPIICGVTDMVIFNCSHTFHPECLDVKDVCSICEDPKINMNGHAKKPDSLLDEDFDEEIRIPDENGLLKLQKEMLSQIQSSFSPARLVAYDNLIPLNKNTNIESSQILKLTPDWNCLS